MHSKKVFENKAHCEIHQIWSSVFPKRYLSNVSVGCFPVSYQSNCFPCLSTLLVKITKTVMNGALFFPFLVGRLAYTEWTTLLSWPPPWKVLTWELKYLHPPFKTSFVWSSKLIQYKVNKLVIKLSTQELKHLALLSWVRYSILRWAYWRTNLVFAKDIV